MRVLVTGAGGLLGGNVVATARERGDEVVGTHHSERPALDAECVQLDVRDEGGIRAVLDRVDPDAVVHCAAVTDVDRCEHEAGLARAVNARAPGTLSAACADRGCDLCHVSTDYVFDGEDGDYAEDAVANPIQVYGETKLAGERAVRDRHPNPTVVRPSFVHGVHRGRDELVGFPAWVRDRVAADDTVPLFVDQHVTPTRAGALAESILELLAAGTTGTYHVASTDCVTPHEFGTAVCLRAGGDPDRIEEGSMEDVDRAARRPQNTCLDVSAVESRLGETMPTLSADLDALEPWLGL